MTTLPLSLADYAAEPNPLVAGVVNILRKESKVMDILPFVDTGSLSIKVIREGGMPALSWRNIGADHGSAKATKPDEVTENAYSIGNEVDVDKVYVKDTSARLYDPRTYQQKMVVKSIARNFSEKFILGLPTDQKNPVGLWWRTGNDLAASQCINANVDISADCGTMAASTQTFIDALDALLYSVTDNLEGGAGVYVVCNDTLLMRINSLFRQSGLLATTQDALGRKFVEYKGATFIDMGLKADEATRIITNVESGTALTGGAATSAYAFKVGREFLTGWQEYGLEVSDWVLQSNQVTYKQVIDWMVGIALSHPRSAARLYGITAA